MKKTNMLLKIGIILIGMVFAICLFSIYYFQLEEPVFLKHYYEISSAKNADTWESEPFSLKYITNITDKRKVIGIFFKEAPDLYFYASEDYRGMSTFTFNNQNGNISLGEKIGRYNLRTVYVNLKGGDNVGNDIESLENLELSQATVQFDNGSTMEVDIGKIILYQINQSENFLESRSSTSSNDGSSSTNYSVKKDITLEKVDSPLMQEVKNLIQLKIGEQDFSAIKGITYKKGNGLYVSSIDGMSQDILSKLTNYDIRPKLFYTDAEGNQYSERIYNIRINQSTHSFLDVVKYLKARGKL